METALDIVLLIIIIVWVVTFIMGPSSRRGSEVIQYETLIKLIDDGKIKVKIRNHRIAEEVASSSIYPQSKFKTYRLKTCIFRIILVVYISILCSLPTVGPIETIIAIVIRAAALRNLSNDVTSVALGNKQVYEIVSAVNGWEYDKSSTDYKSIWQPQSQAGSGAVSPDQARKPENQAVPPRVTSASR